MNSLLTNEYSKIEEAIKEIHESTYDEIEDGYLDTLVRQIVKHTGVKTVIVNRLLNGKEYEDLLEGDGCPRMKLIYHGDPTDSDNEPLNVDEQYFLVKASYSVYPTDAIKRYSVIPLSFIPDSPQVRNLGDVTYHVTHSASLSDTNKVYPEYSTYVGIRLDQLPRTPGRVLPIGVLCVMHDKPIEHDRIDLIYRILLSVKSRTEREIERLRQRDNLIVVKNAALKDAQNKIKFLADMSHEIRTPMNAVIALTDLLLQERTALDEEQAEYLEVIQTSGNHLLTVVNDILDISKINHDPQFKLESRRFSLRKCVKDALNMARHQASMNQHNRSIRLVEFSSDINDNIPVNDLIKELHTQGILPSFLTNDTPKSPLPLLWKIGSDVPDQLMGDTMRLTQILLNLCSNAVKFTKKGGICVRITRYVPTPHRTTEKEDRMSFKERYDAKMESIYTRVMKKQEEDSHEDTEDEEEKVILEISVTDTGIGIPANRLPRLFKSFSQIDISTARRYGGTGLGLAISSMLVNRMGGGLWVESEEGVGSRFALTLPLTVSHSKKKEGQMNTSFPSPGSTNSDESSLGDSTNDTPSTPSTGYFSSQPQITTKKYTQTPELQQMLTKSNTPKAYNTTSDKPPLFTSRHVSFNTQGKKSMDNEDSLGLCHPLRILLAEDNALNQKIALSILKRLGYKEVILAGNGREVLQLMKQYTFDVIFMDLYMPEMDGLEATRYIIHERKKQTDLLNVQDVYIIALTASASNQDREICIDAGMNDFISKPFTMMEMKTTLKNCIKKRK